MNNFSPIAFINGIAVSLDGTRLLPSCSPMSGQEGRVELSASTLQADGVFYPLLVWLFRERYPAITRRTQSTCSRHRA